MAAKLRKFVTINKFSSKTEVGDAFNELRKGINRAGGVVDNIGQNVYQQSTILKFQAEYLTDQGVRQVKIVKKGQRQKNTFFKDYNKRLKRMFGKKKRQKAEDAAESGVKAGAKEADKRFKTIRKPIESFIGMLGKTLGTMVKWFVIYGALDFIQKNPEQVTKLVKFFFTLGKFAFKIASFGVGGVLGGLSNTFGDLSDKNIVERGMRRFVGVFQIIGGIAALRTAQYLIMPWKLIQDVKGINSIFDKTAETTEELRASSKARIKGYRDKKTGVIYSEKEYQAMQKSAQRADSKRAAKAGRGMKSDLYSKQFKDRFQTQFKGKKKGPLAKLQQRGRIGRNKMGKGLGKFAKKVGAGKIAGGLSIIGGVTRIAGGLAQGEQAGEAVGAGVGQAVGGIAGAAALTAVAPFLGPFAPMIGSAIGGFLGEWVGKSFGKMAQPIFEPLGRAFKMYMELAKAIYKPFADKLGPLLGDLFEVLGTLGKMLWDYTKPLRDFYGFVFATGFKVIGKTVGFIVRNAKRLLNPKSVVAGFADALTLNLFDFDGERTASGDKAWWDVGGVCTGDNAKKDKKNKAWWDPAGLFSGDSKAWGGHVGAQFDELATAFKQQQFAEGGLVSCFDTLMKIAGHIPSQRLQEFESGGKVLTVPYYNQRANDDDPEGRKGDTQCYSTVMAMWTSYLTGNTVTTKEYNKTRHKYGTSTDAAAQQKALKDYGIDSKLETGVQGYDNLRKEIDDGYPVPLGMKYTGTGHWAMLTGYSPLGWIVHDPFGQLGMGGTWLKKNSQDSKTDGVGKSYLMKRDIFQDQSPENDIWMWRAPRGLKEITKPKAEEAEKEKAKKKAWWDPLGVFTGKDKKIKTVKTKTGDDDEKEGGTPLEKLLGSLEGDLKKMSEMINTSDDTQQTFTFNDNALLSKAQRDADEELESNVVFVTQTIEKPIINTVGGDQPVISYVSNNNGMLTNGN